MFRAPVCATRWRRALAAALSTAAGMLAILPGMAVGEPVFSVDGAPAASFLLMTLLAISGTLETVPVTSRRA